MNPPPLELYRNGLKNDVIHPDEHQQKAIEILQTLYDDLQKKRSWFSFGKQPPPKGIYLYGGVGRGKSMLMDMFFDSLPESIGKRRVHFHGFMIEVHDFMHVARNSGKDDDDTEGALLKFARQLSRKTRVLCFDEFHVTDIADAMILGRLFTCLFESGVVVVATSNWKPDQLYEGGLQRDLFLPFIELLKANMDSVPVDGPIDFRLQCLSDTGVYFTPLDEDTKAQMNNVFLKLSNGADTYDETLSVKGRNIIVPVVSKNIARFSFSDLCEQPLGAEDFIMIATSYHTVFMDDIPKLGSEQRNEAKRFMLFIDALYEHKTKLVARAETSPEELYSGDDHSFEFKRTVSRLIEMQGEEYLASKRGN